MVNLLTSKLLGDKIILHPDSNLHFVSTFPFDGFKYIPSAALIYKWSGPRKRYWARLVHPLYRKTVKKFLETAVQKNGLAFMDPENFYTNKIIFDIDVNPTYLPIFTEEPPATKITHKSSPAYSLFWVGRLTDFKHMPVCGIINVLNQFNAEQGARFEFHVIGDGKDAEEVKAHASKCPKVKVYFHGHLDEEHLNQLLLMKADIVIGHGSQVKR
jgi:hypothetical protein